MLHRMVKFWITPDFMNPPNETTDAPSKQPQSNCCFSLPINYSKEDSTEEIGLDTNNGIASKYGPISLTCQDMSLEYLSNKLLR
jgi:hypothetical protein